MTTLLLSPGHGYNTAGKRSPYVPPGVLEWEFNRDIVRLIMQKADLAGVSVVNLVPEQEAISLTKRVARATAFYQKDKDCVLVAVHANAAGNGREWSDTAHGSGTFTARRCSETSTALATALAGEIAEQGCFSNRGVKKRDFYILKKTPMPAVLTENGFMTNSSEATKLANPYWRDRIAQAHLDAFLNLL